MGRGSRDTGAWLIVDNKPKCLARSEKTRGNTRLKKRAFSNGSKGYRETSSGGRKNCTFPALLPPLRSANSPSDLSEEPGWTRRVMQRESESYSTCPWQLNLQVSNLKPTGGWCHTGGSLVLRPALGQLITEIQVS
ncbi:hypothetical protein DPEC_G00118990 [Dallia pectoralis]|uniref:Uncharacterized protein n=1 Tax=Dallia pectoralis TaxID=75939 RepID=A0ACC2GPJ3_DALPE|nr:hypothetical protein DPEC_G00118990 [Dallia pectoralis]